MKKIFVTVVSLAVLAAACKNKGGGHEHKDTTKKDTTPVASKEDEKHEDEPELDSATKMNNMMSYMEVGEPQKMMASMNGEWTEELTFYGPDHPPMNMTAKVVNKMVLGGRFQESMHSGSFNGMPFEGKSTMAYDNARKVYMSTWMDNMGTGIMYMEGTMDEGSKTITFTGKGVDPETLKVVEMKETMKMVDDDTQMMEMFEVKNGKDEKVMEIKLTRKGAKKKA